MVLSQRYEYSKLIIDINIDIGDWIKALIRISLHEMISYNILQILLKF
jgi:hypothetical protein